MLNGKPMFGTRLLPSVRRDYVRYHMRTNATYTMYRASSRQLDLFEDRLRPYAESEGLDFY